MSFSKSKHMAVGTKVRVVEPIEVPDWSKWDDDRGRTSSSVKKRLQAAFFKGNTRIHAEVMYISKESERERLRRNGHVKIKLRDPGGCMLVITADPKDLKAVA